MSIGYTARKKIKGYPTAVGEPTHAQSVGTSIRFEERTSVALLEFSGFLMFFE
jgi:hypothetical protein